MAKRTDETVEAERERVDLDDLVDGETGTGEAEAGVAGDATGDVGFDEGQLGVDVDALTGDPDAAAADAEEASDGSGGLLSRVRPAADGPSASVPRPSVPSPLAALPSARSLAVSLVVVVASMLLFGAALPLGGLGSTLGVAAGAFALGVASGRRRYLALVASGAAAAAVSAVVGRIFLSAAADLAVPLAAVGAGGGAAAALLGHYLGRDLRDGLTRTVD